MHVWRSDNLWVFPLSFHCVPEMEFRLLGLAANPATPTELSSRPHSSLLLGLPLGFFPAYRIFLCSHRLVYLGGWRSVTDRAG